MKSSFPPGPAPARTSCREEFAQWFRDLLNYSYQSYAVTGSAVTNAGKTARVVLCTEHGILLQRKIIKAQKYSVINLMINPPPISDEFAAALLYAVGAPAGKTVFPLVGEAAFKITSEQPLAPSRPHPAA